MNDFAVNCKFGELGEMLSQNRSHFIHFFEW